MLGKYHGLFTDKVDVNMPLPVFIDSIGQDEENNNNKDDSNIHSD
ncbi:hypothetical protein [Staphylococcus epidermidis]|nr:hypothetical protein [Staphylococcus epidermidis]